MNDERDRKTKIGKEIVCDDEGFRNEERAKLVQKELVVMNDEIKNLKMDSGSGACENWSLLWAWHFCQAAVPRFSIP